MQDSKLIVTETVNCRANYRFVSFCLLDSCWCLRLAGWLKSLDSIICSQASSTHSQFSALKQLAAPAEFVSQHVEVVVILGMNKPQALVALADDDFIAGQYRQGDVTIAADFKVFAIFR